jgi:hypothetical protein
LEGTTGWLKDEALGRPVAQVFHIIDGITRKAVPDPMELVIEKNQASALPLNKPSILARELWLRGELLRRSIF